MIIFARLLLWLALVAGLSAPALAQFPEQRVYGGTAGGSANAQTLTIPNFGATVPPGVPVRFLPVAANTTATTLTIAGGSGAIAVCKPSPSGLVALTGGELQVGQPVEVLYSTVSTCYALQSLIDGTVSSLVAPPQGRLTLSTGVPVQTADVTAGTSLFYAPYVGNQAPIYNGSKMVMQVFSQLTITIPSSRLANLIYDVCLSMQTGSVVAAIGPAWSNSSAAAGSRGTGAGTPELTYVAGYLVNAVSISAVNGATTYTIAANQCTYIGSIQMDGTNGQLSGLLTYGQARKMGYWNMYNRVPLRLKGGDASASWTNASTTIVASHSDSNNKISAFTGVAEEPIFVSYYQKIASNTAGSNPPMCIGLNSTSACNVGLTSALTSTGAASFWTYLSQYLAPPALGLNVFTALEAGTAGTTTFTGTEASQNFAVQYRY